MIMTQIDSVTKAVEQSWEKMKGELKVEVQNSKARVISQVEYVRGVIDHQSRSNVILSMDSLDINV